jgi:hypothetical protein
VLDSPTTIHQFFERNKMDSVESKSFNSSIDHTYIYISSLVCGLVRVATQINKPFSRERNSIDSYHRKKGNRPCSSPSPYASLLSILLARVIHCSDPPWTLAGHRAKCYMSLKRQNKNIPSRHRPHLQVLLLPPSPSSPAEPG